MDITVLAVDPGITTGYCHAVIGDGVLMLHPFQSQDGVRAFYDTVNKIQPRHLIMEDFEHRQRQRTKVILFPVQLIGVANLWADHYDRVVTLQKPAQGKSFYSNEQLKRLGAYKRGIPHAMDATRHLFQWLTFGPGFQFCDPDNTDIGFFYSH